MWENIISKDQQLLSYLNNLGTELWDPVFMYITNQINWWPFCLVLIYILVKKMKLEQFGLWVLVLSVCFVFTDPMTNVVQYAVARLRTVNDPLIEPYLRVLRKAGSPSCFSGHASNSSGSVLIVFL